MNEAAPSAGGHRRFKTYALLGSTALSLLGAEAAVRIYLHAIHPRVRPDAKSGWRCVENYRWEGLVSDASGHAHRMTYSTDARGFRLFGDARAPRPKILVLGDSFTQGAAVSDDETYAALLRASSGAEVFAYGTGGYGTLQEYFILDEVFDEVRPDLVLWQFCTNDFVNNDEALERASRWDNNGMRRPYLDDDGRIYSAVPKPLPWLRELGGTSKLVFAAFVGWDRLGALRGDTVEREIQRVGETHPGLVHSAATTKRILEMVRARCGPVPVVSFSADDRKPFYAVYQRICAECGIEVIDGVPQAVRAASKKGIEVRAADLCHWNDTGHRIVAETIRARLTRVRAGDGTLLLGEPRAHEAGPRRD